MAGQFHAAATMAMLARVAMRMRLARLGVWAFRGLLVAAGVYAALLLVSRLTGLIPDRFEPWTLAIVPGVAVLAGLLLHRGPTTRQAAMRADEATGSKDLFLTAAAIDGTPGQYQPLVLRDAEAKAAATKPAAVVPFNPWNRVAYSAAAMLVLAGLFFVPQLDPFGEKEQEKLLTQRKEQLKQEQEMTVRRATQLAKAQPEAELSAPVAQKLDELMKTFRQMKPQDPQGNLNQLSEQRKALEDEWRKASEKKLQEATQNQSMAQRFGAGNTSAARQMKEAMSKGDSSPAKEKLADLQKKAEQLQQTTDPAEKQKLQQQMKQGLQEMSAMAGEMGASQLNDALNRAMQQLDAASLDQLSQQAQQALQQSLQLSQQEMEQLAQSARDMQALEQALQTAQLAQALNNMQPLDGTPPPQGQPGQGQCQSLSQYAQLYQQMMQQAGGGGGSPLGLPMLNPGRGAGAGGGMGGPGIGRGGTAPENPNQAMTMQTEKSQSALQAGKILMQIKTQGVGEKGEVKEDYRAAVAEVKQGVSEAILQEQVPPGYHDAIRQYFDTIEQPASTLLEAAPANPGGAPAAPR